MRTRLILILCLTLNQLFLCSAQVKHKSEPAILEISGFKAQRAGDTISYEGHVRNAGQTAARQVTLFFLVRDPDGKVLTKRVGPLDPADLPPGGEAEIAFEMPWTEGAVSVKIEAADSRMKGIKVTGTQTCNIE